MFTALLSVSADTFTGPVSPYYLDFIGSGSSQIVEIQGTSVINSFTVDFPVFAVAGGTIYTRWPNPSTSTGSQYTLAGVPTGNTDFFAAPPNTTLELSYDGTSDGTYAYYVDDLSFINGVTSWNVYRANLDWSNPVLLFAPGGSFWQGIAYDPDNQSLWLSRSNFMGDYSLDGSLITSFTTSVSGRALGYDPADGTLWTFSSASFFQYSTSGVLLQTGSIAGVAGGVYAGEILNTDPPSDPAVPEPGSFSLLVCCAVLGVVQWRRRTSRSSSLP